MIISCVSQEGRWRETGPEIEDTMAASGGPHRIDAIALEAFMRATGNRK